MPNRIHRSARRNPRTISDRICSGALLPGTGVFIGNIQLTQANSASGGRLGLLTNREYYQMSGNAYADMSDPLYTPYANGESGIAYILEPGDEFMWAMALGTYSNGQELTVGAGGRLTAALTGNVVVAYFDQPSMGVAAGLLCDVVIAGFHTKS